MDRGEGDSTRREAREAGDWRMEGDEGVAREVGGRGARERSFDRELGNDPVEAA
jgi:hypothetical protein